MEAHGKPTEDQRDLAALWFVRRTGGAAAGEAEAEFTAWLAADPWHRSAYDDVEDLWIHLEAPAARLAAQSSSIGRRQEGWRCRKTWALAPMAAFAAFGLFWIADPSMSQDWRADAVTSRGEQKTFALPDGSKLHAAADTALKFDFEGGRRQVELLRGEAYFEVRPGQANAFAVRVGGDRVDVAGTKFDVDRRGDATIVTVREGAVDVLGQKSSAVRIEQGRRVVVAAGKTAPVEPADVDAVLAWMSRRLVFQNLPLRDVAIVLQRQVKGRFFVLGSLADAKISGTFPMDDAPSSLDTIGAAIGANVVRLTPWLTIVY
jgi:transmembrane sensor